MKVKPGDIVDGKYRIVRLLGEGGMGAVYEGENQRIHRRVAIKILHASAAAKTTAVRRFEQEATAAGRIGSEHIVEVLDLGSLPSGEQYMVMEFLEGEDLGARIKRSRRLTPHQTAPIIVQLLEGLAAAHKAGIIHRDLKPDNVFLVRSLAGQRDFVKVVDFGVSKFSELETEGMSMTSTGAVVGTPYYLSPEQARGVRQLDARSDLYSVGVVLYQAVTGRLPFHAETFNELVFKIALESPEPAEVVVPDLDPAFAAIIAKAMVRETTGRFQTAAEFQEALSRWMDEHPDPNAAPVGRPSASSMSPTRTTGAGPEALGAPGSSQGLPTSTVALDAVTPMPAGPGPGPGPGPGFAQSSPQLGASQAGVTVATAPPKKTGTVVAVTAAVMLALAGGAFGAYKMVTGGDAHGLAAPQGATTTSAQADPQATPPKTVTTAADATQAPTAEPITSGSPSAAPTDVPATPASAQPAGPWPPKPGTTSIAAAPTGTLKKPDTTGAPTSTGAATAPPKPTGRVIGGEL